jgi:hypothetical protein
MLTLGALLGASTIAEAACRPESNLACNQVIDTNLTRVFQTGRNRFAIQLVFTNRVQFRCNGTGGNLPLPPGCPKDGVQYKPEISANVAAAGNNPQLCTIIEGTTTRSGATSVGVRIRFEEKNAPKRKTCVIRFDMPSDSPSAPKQIPFTLVNSTNVAPDE